MLLKSEIEHSYLAQQQGLRKQPEYTPRFYLNKLQQKGSFIEVISGIRRCGKSTLMKLLMQQYKLPVAYFNFEDPRIFGFDVNDFPKLDEVMGPKNGAYFFDEIQNVPSWETFVRHLHDRGEKVFITGSNASLLSKELGTRLTGRHIRHELFPFSYSEFLEHNNLKNTEPAFEKYLQLGGFPEYLASGNQEVLQTLFKDIVLRDIAVRYGVRNTKTLMDISLYLISNIAKEFTFGRLQKTFMVGSANSVADYLSWLEDAYLLFYLPRFSWSARVTSKNPRKVYAIDNGLIQANSLSFSNDRGRLLENAVYLHLRQSRFNLFYFKETRECDFVIFDKNKCHTVIQVCDTITTDNKERELAGLLEAMQFFNLKEGFIITKGQKETLVIDKNKIQLLPANEFIAKSLLE